MLRPPSHPPTRAEFEPATDDDADLRGQHDSHDSQRPASNAEKRYRAALKRWQAYEAWKTQRNPARAQLEHAYGYDTKHAMHLIRLIRMGIEILELGDVRVRRPDAAELKAIRNGAWTFEEFRAAAQHAQQHLQAAAESTRLPDDVDKAQVDELASALMLAG